MSKGNLVLGVLTGVAIGAITGILCAPEKGSTTRKQILDKADDYFGNLKSKMNDFIVDISKKFEDTVKDAEEVALKSKSKFDEAEHKVKNIA